MFSAFLCPTPPYSIISLSSTVRLSHPRADAGHAGPGGGVPGQHPHAHAVVSGAEQVQDVPGRGSPARLQHLRRDDQGGPRCLLWLSSADATFPELTETHCSVLVRPQLVEDDFVDMRKDDPQAVTAEDLHRMLVVARWAYTCLD